MGASIPNRKFTPNMSILSLPNIVTPKRAMLALKIAQRKPSNKVRADSHKSAHLAHRICQFETSTI